LPKQTHALSGIATAATRYGITPETAASVLGLGFADIIAFGRSFLANPDLVNRIINNEPLNQVDFNTLYTPGAKGYTDYPSLRVPRQSNPQKSFI
jgi:N-ethylmaleimide reductase